MCFKGLQCTGASQKIRMSWKNTSAWMSIHNVAAIYMQKFKLNPPGKTTLKWGRRQYVNKRLLKFCFAPTPWTHQSQKCDSTYDHYILSSAVVVVNIKLTFIVISFVANILRILFWIGPFFSRERVRATNYLTSMPKLSKFNFYE